MSAGTVNVQLVEETIVVRTNGGQGPTGQSGPANSTYADRTALAVANPSNQSAILMEPGRVGLFRWSSADHSLDVAADLWQGIYVAPQSDPSGASGAWVRQLVAGTAHPEWFGAQGNGTADDKLAIVTALEHPAIKRVLLTSSSYGVKSKVWVPEGKELDALGPENTELLVLPDYDLSGSTATKRHFVLSCELGAKNVRIRNLSVNGNKVGLGLGVDNRVTLICPQGEGFLVENCWAFDGTGYALYARGETGQEASGTFKHCRSWNCDTLQETAHARDVLFFDCHSHDGDGDIPVQEALIPWSDSWNITYEDCSYTGSAGAGIGMTPVSQDLTGIVFKNVRIEMTSDNLALNVEENPAAPALRTKAKFIGCSLKSNGNASSLSIGALLKNCDIDFMGSTVEGARGIVLGNNAVIRGDGSKAIGRADSSAAYVTRGLVNEGTGSSAIWTGGSLEAYGSSTPDYRLPYVGDNIQVSRETELIPAQVYGEAGQEFLIEEYAPDGATASRVFLIPAGYKKLRIEAVARSDAAAVAANLNMQINEDLAANYDTQFLAANNATASASVTLAGTAINLGVATGATAPAGEHGITEAVIHLPDSADVRKHGQAKTSYKTADSGPGLFCREQAFWWRSLAAITSLRLTLSAGNFTTSSRVRIIGVR